MMPNKMSGSNSFDTTGKIIMDNCLCRTRVVSEEIGHIKGMEDIRVLRRACKKKGCWLQQPF